MKHPWTYIKIKGLQEPITDDEVISLLHLDENEPNDPVHQKIIQDQWNRRFIQDQSCVMKIFYKLLYESYRTTYDYMMINNLWPDIILPLNSYVTLPILTRWSDSKTEQFKFYQEAINRILDALLSFDISVDLTLSQIQDYELARINDEDIDQKDISLADVWSTVAFACMKIIDLLAKIREVPKENRVSVNNPPQLA